MHGRGRFVKYGGDVYLNHDRGVAAAVLATMAQSDSSSLSSAPSTDDEAMEKFMSRPTGINRYFKPYVLADRDAVAFLVMFRSRFHDAFPKSLPHYGPQDIERGVSGEVPDEQMERLLCALLGLVLNRKKDVERGHYGRALEEAIASNHNQWPTAWKGVNPLQGGASFSTMTPDERLVLLKTLVLWALNSSDVVQALIKESYKQTRRDDDKNQPRSVQPWFSDSYRRRYWLIEGLEDSHFRIYRENDGRTAKSNTWFSVAGTIDEVSALADKFAAEATTNAKINSDKLRSAVPRFEAGEVKRQRKEYRIARKAAFSRPEPGFSLYEGRTRGKRMKYTFSDGEEDTDYSTRRSTRNATPHDSLPTITASGRQVKPRLGRLYGDSPLPDQQQQDTEQGAAVDTNGDESAAVPTLTAAGRPMRGAARPKRPAPSPRQRYGEDLGSDSDEHHSDGQEWSGNEDESDKDSEPDFDQDDGLDGDDDDDEEMTDQGLDEDELQDEGGTQESLVVQLRYRKAKTPAGDGSHISAAAREAATDVNGGGPVIEYRPLAPAPPRTIEPALAAPPVPPAPVQPTVEHAMSNGVQSHGPGGAGVGANIGDNGVDIERYARPQLQVMDVS
ncbi:hypothetical protein DV737_g228, partial [Chaetothyriales sp. CBS 132003]